MDERNTKVKKQIVLIFIISLVFSLVALAQPQKPQTKAKAVVVAKDTSVTVSLPIITFIELGSVNCIPCKAMQKVMKAVEDKYGRQLKIIFYDVWKQEQAHYAEEYKVRLIPTQIFLDTSGKELLRHEGFYPEKEIDIFLQSKGLKPNSSVKG
jgi:thioredoxin 1